MRGKVATYNIIHVVLEKFVLENINSSSIGWENNVSFLNVIEGFLSIIWHLCDGLDDDDFPSSAVQHDVYHQP